MYIVAIDESTCTGCNSCVDPCPAHILSFADDHAYVSGDEAECLGCLSCVSLCPSGAITVTEM